MTRLRYSVFLLVFINIVNGCMKVMDPDTTLAPETTTTSSISSTTTTTSPISSTTTTTSSISSTTTAITSTTGTTTTTTLQNCKSCPDPPIGTGCPETGDCSAGSTLKQNTNDATGCILKFCDISQITHVENADGTFEAIDHIECTVNGWQKMGWDYSTADPFLIGPLDGSIICALMLTTTTTATSTPTTTTEPTTTTLVKNCKSCSAPPLGSGCPDGGDCGDGNPTLKEKPDDATGCTQKYCDGVDTYVENPDGTYTLIEWIQCSSEGEWNKFDFDKNIAAEIPLGPLGDGEIVCSTKIPVSCKSCSVPPTGDTCPVDKDCKAGNDLQDKVNAGSGCLQKVCPSNLDTYVKKADGTFEKIDMLECSPEGQWNIMDTDKVTGALGDGKIVCAVDLPVCVKTDDCGPLAPIAECPIFAGPNCVKEPPVVGEDTDEGTMADGGCATRICSEDQGLSTVVTLPDKESFDVTKPLICSEGKWYTVRPSGERIYPVAMGCT